MKLKTRMLEGREVKMREIYGSEVKDASGLVPRKDINVLGR